MPNIWDRVYKEEDVWSRVFGSADNAIENPVAPQDASMATVMSRTFTPPKPDKVAGMPEPMIGNADVLEDNVPKTGMEVFTKAISWWGDKLFPPSSREPDSNANFLERGIAGASNFAGSMMELPETVRKDPVGTGKALVTGIAERSKEDFTMLNAREDPAAAGKAVSKRLDEWNKDPFSAGLDIAGFGAGVLGVVGKSGKVLSLLKKTGAIASKPKDIGLMAWIRTPSNLVGAIPGQKQAYGSLAAETVHAMNKADIDMAIEVGARREAMLGRVKEMSKNERKAFYDLVEGNSMRDIEAMADVSEGTKGAASMWKMMQESDRTYVITDARNKMRSSVTKELSSQFPTGTDPKIISQAVEAELAKRMPNDWGVDDYLPHVFPGQFLIKYDGNTVGSAMTKLDAKIKLSELAKSNPTNNPSLYSVDYKQINIPDILRTSDANRWRVVKEVSDAANITPAEALDATKGIIGTKSAKKKFDPFLQKRTGAEGYSKDFEAVFDLYNNATIRHRYLTQLNSEVQPMIEGIKRQGRPNLAKYLDETFEYQWGKPSEASLLFDESLQSIPGINQIVKPMALDRWTNQIKNWTTIGLLKLSPRFHALNSLQTFQTLAPIVDAADFAKGRALYHTKEGAELLARHQVGYISGGKLLEGGKSVSPLKIREKLKELAPETSNQEVAWLTMYQKATKMGLPDQQAANYAFMRGNLYSQFLPMKSDTPKLFRGPIGSTVFQFKRFPVKTMEIGYDMIREGNISGMTKFVGAQLMVGGTRALTGPLAKTLGGGYLTLKAYNAIKDSAGEDVANVVHFGLPSLAGVDLSYSAQLYDIPKADGIPEYIGQLLTGPAVSVATRVIKSVKDTKGTVETGIERAMRGAAESVGAFRPLLALEKVFTDDYDFKTPAGKLKFRGDFADAVKQFGGFRPVEQGQIDMVTDAMFELKRQRDVAIDDAVIRALKEDETALEQVIKFNALYPELEITNREIINRAKRRDKAMNTNQLDKMLKGSGKLFLTNPEFQLEIEEDDEESE